MTNLSCPSCGHTFDPTASSALPTPEPSVVQWFRSSPGWLGEISTDEVYEGYVRSTDATPVSRRRFVADLAYLGFEEVLDDETAVLIRP